MAKNSIIYCCNAVVFVCLATSAHAQLSSAVNPVPAVDAAPSSPPKPAADAAPAKTGFGFQDTVKIPEPPTGKGQIVFFRPSAMGYAILCHPRENGHLVTKLGNSKYSVVTVDAGKHGYSVTGKDEGDVNVTVGAGETYYIRCTIKVGMWAGHPQIYPSSSTEFQSEASRLKIEDPDKIAKTIEDDKNPKAK